MPNLVLGIDPGTVAGAYTVIDVDTAELVILSLFDNWQTVHENLRSVKHPIQLAVIEQISARPGESRKASCTFCGNLGGWQATTALYVPRTELVLPRKWQARIGGRAVVYNSKQAIHDVVSRIWPSLAELQLKNKAKRYGYSDALGIALYARELLLYS